MEKETRGAGIPAPKSVSQELKHISKTGKIHTQGRPPDAQGAAIQVVAIQDGFYGNRRRSVGDKFSIENEGQLGKWMEVI